MAKGQEKGEKGERRQHPKRHPILNGRRITGTIVTWKGTIGWIKPNSEIDHPEAEMHRGEVFLHRSDLVSGAEGGRLRGARVNFTLYADGTGLGAQQCRVVTQGAPRDKGEGKGEAREARGVQRTIGKRPLVGRFAARSLGASGRSAGRMEAAESRKPQPWVRGGKGADPGPRDWGRKGANPGPRDWGRKGGVKGKGKEEGKGKSKGSGKGLKGGKGKRKGKGKGPKELPLRKRIGGRLLGKILRWSRSFGWIEALDPIEHPAASKHDGEVFAHADDVLSGKTPREGDSVDFLPYADRSGLGAEKLRILERADGNDEGEELEDLDELEEAEAMEAAHAVEEQEEEEEEEKPQEAEDADPEQAEAQDTAEGEEKPAGKAKPKGGSKGKLDAKGKAKGKSKGAENGKGKATTKKPFDAFSVQKTIEKRPLPPPPPAPVHEKPGKGKALMRGSIGEKGKGAATVMQIKPKAASSTSAAAGKAQAKGGKPQATTAKAAPAGGKAPAAGAAGKAGRPAKGSGKSSSAASGSQKGGGLPENWEEHWSEDHGVPYFWNKKTKESRWIRPTA